MYYSKKAGRLIIIYSLAAVLVMGAFFLRANRERDALRRTVAEGCDHAFLELTAAVGELDTSLKKTLCAGSPSMVSTVCAESFAHCAAASQAIASLPYGNIQLEHTAAFLAKTGDYMFYLSRSAAGGRGLSDQERQSLAALSQSAQQVSEALSGLSARLLAGDVSTQSLERAEDQIAGAEDSLVDTGMASGFKDMETELPEMPSLIYDGPFSEHIEKAEPKLLEGLGDIGQEDAARAAAVFLNAKPETVAVQCLREGRLPVYVLTHQNGSEVQTVEVTKKGGKVIYFNTVREPQEGTVAPLDAVRTAGRFLEHHGYSSMTPTYWTAEGGELIANFAYQQGDVICYPDLIKVTVALDSGRVTGLEAKGYVMNHASRDLSALQIDPAEAAGRLSPLLTVSSSRAALIPTAGKNEVLCIEYLTQTQEGRKALVYVNAQTGAEEKILLLLESDSGTLTI